MTYGSTRLARLSMATIMSMVALTGVSFAQQGTQPPPVDVPGQAPAARVVAGQDGFAIESGDGEYRLQIGLLLQADGRFDLDDVDDAVIDTFAIRRLRPYLRGRILRRFEFYLNPDFAGGDLVLQDAYFDTILSTAFRVRTGKGKEPLGMERLYSASNLFFMERAYPSEVAPNRDVGIQVLGDIHGGVVSYIGGVMNGVADGASGNLDTNDAKDLIGRLVVRPFNGQKTNPLHGLGVAVAGSTGEEQGSEQLPTFKTTTLQQTFFTYVTGAIANGRRNRYSPQVFYFQGPFGALFEYVRSDMPVTLNGTTADIAIQGWQVAASWVLTGEAATDAAAGIRPRAIFDPDTGHWGAFQVAARVQELLIDQSAVDLGFATPGSSRKAQAWTVGLNWVLTGNVKYVLNFERTIFDDNRGTRPPENALAFRTQLFF